MSFKKSKTQIPDSELLLYLKQEYETQQWIQRILHVKIKDDEEPSTRGFGKWQSRIRSGVVLCYLMKELAGDNAIPRIQHSTKHVFKVKENISFFLDACVEELELKPEILFKVTDLWENYNFPRVIRCLRVLAEKSNLKNNTPSIPEAENFDQTLEGVDTDLLRSKLAVFRTQRGRVGKISAEIMRRKMHLLAGNNVDMYEVEKGITKFQAIVRGHFDRKLYKKRVRDQAYRDNVVKEILSTEKSYVDSLSCCLSVFMKPLLQSAANPKTKILTTAETKQLFSDLPTIVNFNTLLLEKLEERIGAWSPYQRLGDIFLEIIAFLKVYTNYVQNFNHALVSLEQFQHNERFVAFINERKEDARVQLELPAYLIMPVQRIPRYNLLLRDLTKHTWNEHRDYEDLSKALEGIQEVANTLNEKKREAENMAVMVQVCKKIRGKFSMTIAEPHRRFIRELTLSDEKHVLFIFNDVLFVCKKQSEATTTLKKMKNMMGSKDTYRYVKHFMLTSIKVDEAKQDKHGYVLNVNKDQGKKKDMFRAKFTHQQSAANFRTALMDLKTNIQKNSEVRALLIERNQPTTLDFSAEVTEMEDDDPEEILKARAERKKILQAPLAPPPIPAATTPSALNSEAREAEQEGSEAEDGAIGRFSMLIAKSGHQRQLRKVHRQLTSPDVTERRKKKKKSSKKSSKVK